MAATISLAPSSEWDFAHGAFEEEIASLSPQGREKLGLVAQRKNWKKYSSTRDFLFCEVAGKNWVKAALSQYQGKGPVLVAILTKDQLGAWSATMSVAAKILNSTLEFKTFSSFRRTVLLKAVREALKNN